MKTMRKEEKERGGERSLERKKEKEKEREIESIDHCSRGKGFSVQTLGRAQD